MDNKENKPNKNLAYYMGQLFAAVLSLCLTTAVIALCVKFLFWLFY